jgi:hypothetical protein
MYAWIYAGYTPGYTPGYTQKIYTGCMTDECKMVKKG